MPRIAGKEIPSRWLTAAALTAVAAVYGVFVYLPTHRMIGQLREELRAREHSLDQTADYASALHAVEQRRDAAAAYVERWRAVTPVRGGVHATFARIQATADRTGLTTTRFDPKPPVRLTAVKRVPATLACRGSFDQVFAFLGGLDALPQSVWVERLLLSVAGEDGDDLRCEVSLDVFVDIRDTSD